MLFSSVLAWSQVQDWRMWLLEKSTCDFFINLFKIVKSVIFYFVFISPTLYSGLVSVDFSVLRVLWYVCTSVCGVGACADDRAPGVFLYSSLPFLLTLEVSSSFFLVRNLDLHSEGGFLQSRPFIPLYNSSYLQRGKEEDQGHPIIHWTGGSSLYLRTTKKPFHLTSILSLFLFSVPRICLYPPSNAILELMSSCLSSRDSDPLTHWPTSSCHMVPLWDGSFSRCLGSSLTQPCFPQAVNCPWVPVFWLSTEIRVPWTLNSYIWFLITSMFIKCILKIEILSNWNATQHFKGRKAPGHISSFVHWCLSTTGNTVRVLSLLFQTILFMTVEKWKKLGKILLPDHSALCEYFIA